MNLWWSPRRWFAENYKLDEMSWIPVIVFCTAIIVGLLLWLLPPLD